MVLHFRDLGQIDPFGVGQHGPVHRHERDPRVDFMAQLYDVSLQRVGSTGLHQVQGVAADENRRIPQPLLHLLTNLIFLPVAKKLEGRTEERVMLMYMVLEGITMLNQHRTPSLIRETLKSFVAQFDDEIRAPAIEEIEQSMAEAPAEKS